MEKVLLEVVVNVLEVVALLVLVVDVSVDVVVAVVVVVVVEVPAVMPEPEPEPNCASSILCRRSLLKCRSAMRMFPALVDRRAREFTRARLRRAR